MITLSLLEALLSSNGQQRQAAEAHLQSLDVNQRVFGWPVVWQQVEQAVVEPQLNTALSHMIAVLWRRDILTCSTNVATLLEPLQQIFASDSKLVVDDKIRSAIGYCLAEVVALLHTSAALEQTLQATQVMVCRCVAYMLTTSHHLTNFSLLTDIPFFDCILAVFDQPWPRLGTVPRLGTGSTGRLLDTTSRGLDA